MDTKLLIVTDLGLFKAYKVDRTLKGSPHLDLLEQIVLEEAHHRLVETVTDLAGRRGAPTQRNWGTPLADDHTQQLETRRRLVKEVAEHVERLSQSHSEMPIWFAAPAEFNGQILEALSANMRDRIQINRPRDLVKLSKAQLLEAFAPDQRQSEEAAVFPAKAP